MDPLELDLQVVVPLLLWVLETELRSSARIVSLINTETSFLSLIIRL